MSMYHIIQTYRVSYHGTFSVEPEPNVKGIYRIVPEVDGPFGGNPDYVKCFYSIKSGQIEAAIPAIEDGQTGILKVCVKALSENIFSSQLVRFSNAVDAKQISDEVYEFDGTEFDLGDRFLSFPVDGTSHPCIVVSGLMDTEGTTYGGTVSVAVPDTDNLVYPTNVPDGVYVPVWNYLETTINGGMISAYIGGLGKQGDEITMPVFGTNNTMWKTTVDDEGGAKIDVPLNDVVTYNV